MPYDAALLHTAATLHLTSINTMIKRCMSADLLPGTMSWNGCRQQARDDLRAAVERRRKEEDLQEDRQEEAEAAAAAAAAEAAARAEEEKRQVKNIRLTRSLHAPARVR